MKESVGVINVPIALASLAISILLWFVVLPQHLSSQNRTFHLDLRPIGLDRTQFHINRIDKQMVVRAKVSDQEYDNLNKKDLYAEVDLSKAVPGSSNYVVSIYPRELETVVQGSTRVEVALERMVSIDVPVVSSSTGKLSDSSLILDDMDIETKKVHIEGPESEVVKVNSAQATLRLDMVDPHDPQPVEVTLEPFDESNHLVTNVEVHPSKVLIKPKLSPSPQSKLVFLEARFTGKVPDGYVVTGYSMDPDRVTASGPSRILKGIAKLSTEPIDVSQLTGTQTLTAPIQIPAGLSRLDTKEVRVTITILPVTVKSLNPPGGPPKVGTTRASVPGSNRQP